ncbi:MAG: hypothetical protein J7496_08060 [Novosphingobium sp.]|nr:hypothetical protein [Novosphingobium sp.]
MLALDDPHWSDLNHAYGEASDIPDLINALARNLSEGSEERWFGLWSALCHQGDAYVASYAAVPHLVAIARNLIGPIDFNFFQFSAQIEIARLTGRAPEIPPGLAESYHSSLKALAELAFERRHEEWDDAALISILSVLALAKGNHKLAEAISNLDDRLIQKLIDLDFD